MFLQMTRNSFHYNADGLVNIAPQGVYFSEYKLTDDNIMIYTVQVIATIADDSGYTPEIDFRLANATYCLWLPRTKS